MQVAVGCKVLLLDFHREPARALFDLDDIDTEETRKAILSMLLEKGRQGTWFFGKVRHGWHEPKP